MTAEAKPWRAALKALPSQGQGKQGENETKHQDTKDLPPTVRDVLPEDAQKLYLDAYNGICAQCGQTIHPDRLAVVPDTHFCIRCARVGEQAAVR